MLCLICYMEVDQVVFIVICNTCNVEREKCESATAEIRRGKKERRKKKNKEERNHRTKI